MKHPPLTPNAWLRRDAAGPHLRRADPIDSILEIGAGQGSMGSRLAALASYVAIEPDKASAEVARSRLPAGTEICPSLAQLDPNRLFTVVCAFEVLEHIDDDAAALNEWTRRVAPGGWLIISVPADQKRFSSADERVGHFRRYDENDLTDLMSRMDMEDVLIERYGFPLGYLLETARNLAARRGKSPDGAEDRTASSGRYLQPSEWMAAGTMLATAPFRLMQRPFRRSHLGTGLILSARRPKSQ